jgi:hypothetical protein
MASYGVKHRSLSFTGSLSFIDSVFDSDGLSAAFPGSRTARYAPGAAAVVRFIAGGFSLATEYNMATRQIEFVHEDELVRIRPSAWMLEGAYRTLISGKKSYVAFRYSQTHQLADGAFPKRRLLSTVATWLFEGFRLGAEYGRDYDYDGNAADFVTFSV